MIHKNPILVTGMPRSGTTWVGHMISQARFVRYIHEPFNISNPSCVCGMKFHYSYFYLFPGNFHKYSEHLMHTFYPAYNWIGFSNMIRGALRNKKIRYILNYGKSLLYYQPVVKEPAGIFSANTIADMFEMDVVVLIRHPAAIVNSYKTLNWKPPFDHLLNQPALMEDHLSDYRLEIEDFVRNEYDIVDQAALLWKLIYHMVIRYRETQADWCFIQYENIALHPIEGYENLFKQLNLPFTERTRRMIHKHMLKDQPGDTPNPYAIKQNPQHAISKWKNQLTPEEIHRIRLRVEEVSSVFYTEDDWSIATV